MKWTLIALAAGLLAGTGARAAAKPPIPDFTQGGKKSESHDWLLGPTGARGWIYFQHEDQTAVSRQILITAVDAGSPADGVLRVNDVILGVNGTPFADDARKCLARAITAAEDKTGALRLIRWRDGQSANVALKLALLGGYGDSAPYGCPKSRKIFEQGCQLIAKRGLKEVDIPADLNALALLASGKMEYRPLLADYAKRVANYQTDSMATWYYGYANMFLAEYCMATGDRSVLPGIKRLAMEAALGQSAVGTWGHKFARPDGNLNGYGCMNQPGLSLMISLVLARQAGVSDPALDKAITKGAGFLRYYVNKGSIPYGDHQPGASHENNGMCSSSAVLFDLLGEREAAAFFSKMATAAYDEREHGHCGNFWNMLWAMPGASRCGPLATGAYMKEQSWYYDLARNWKGDFVYQPIEAGEEHQCYTNWDLTGCYLLTYALPLKSLYLLGKRPAVAPPLKANEVSEVIAAGRDVYPVNGNNGYDARSTEQLLAGLSSWSPATRNRSAQALGRRKENLVPTLTKLLATDKRDTRYGACEALGCLGSRTEAAAPPLRAVLKETDPWLQSLACKALLNLGQKARNDSVNDLLAMVLRPNPDDPRRIAHRAASVALFYRYPGTNTVPILNGSLAGVDRSLLLPAMQAILRNDDAAARQTVGFLYARLNERDLAAMMPAIIKSIEKLAPSDEMFGDGIRLAGLDLVSRLHIREGLPLCVAVMEPERWGGHNRIVKCLEYLARYGTHAKAAVPQLKEMSRTAGDWKNAIDKAIAAIEASTETPALVNLKDFSGNAGQTVPGATSGDPPGADAARFIDEHVHFQDCHQGDLDKVAEWMKVNRVERCINHPLAQSRAKNDAERRQMLENYAKYPGRIARFCIIFPDEVSSVDEAVKLLMKEKQDGAIGFGEHYGVDLKFDDPKNLRLYEACAKVGLPVMFHMDRNKNLDEKGLPRLEHVLQLYPKCLLIAHGDWWKNLQDGTCDRLLKTYPNLVADISCTVGRSLIGHDKEFARAFFIRNADKLLFGTDSGWWSIGKAAAPEFALLDELDLPAGVLDKIRRGNAERLLWGGNPGVSKTN